MSFNVEEHNWLQKAKQNPKRYTIQVDNDSVWVVDTEQPEEEQFVFSFDSFKNYFIYELLDDMGFSVRMN